MCMKTKETWTNRPTESRNLRRNDMRLTAKNGFVTHHLHLHGVFYVFWADTVHAMA
jgi:hypothetical protein